MIRGTAALSGRNYKIILKPWEQPINHIRVYLGEQMGFYFLFVSAGATSTSSTVLSAWYCTR